MWSRQAPGCCHCCHRCHRQHGGGPGSPTPSLERPEPPPPSPMYGHRGPPCAQLQDAEGPCPMVAAGCPLVPLRELVGYGPAPSPSGAPCNGAGAPAAVSGSRSPHSCPRVPPAHVPTRVHPHLLQQRQLAEELVCAVLGQEVGPLGAGLGVGAADVLEEAGLGQGRRDGVLVLLVQGQRQPVAPCQPPGEALQGRPVSWQAWGHPARSWPRAPQTGSTAAREQMPPARSRVALGRFSGSPKDRAGEVWDCPHRSWKGSLRPGPPPRPLPDNGSLAPGSGRCGHLSVARPLCCPCLGEGGQEVQPHRAGHTGECVHVQDVCARVCTDTHRMCAGAGHMCPLHMAAHRACMHVCACAGYVCPLHTDAHGMCTRACVCTNRARVSCTRSWVLLAGKGPHLAGDAVFGEPLAEGVEGSDVLLGLPGALQVCAPRGALGPLVCGLPQEAQQALGGAVWGQDLDRITGVTVASQAGLWLPPPACGRGPARRSPWRRGSPGASPAAQRSARSPPCSNPLPTPAGGRSSVCRSW